MPQWPVIVRPADVSGDREWEVRWTVKAMPLVRAHRRCFVEVVSYRERLFDHAGAKSRTRQARSLAVRVAALASALTITIPALADPALATY